METASIKKNFAMNATLAVAQVLFPLITVPYVSRVLQPVGTGKVAFAVSLISYFSMFAQLGIPTYGIRACARVRDDREALTRTAQELLLINLVMSAIAYAALFLVLLFVPQLREDRTLYLVVSLTILFNTIGMEWLYMALERYTYITIRSLTFKAVAAVAVFLLIKSQGDYVVYGAITIFAASASNILNFLHARRIISLRPVGGYHFRPHLAAVAVFFAMACATTVYTNLDVVMLGFLTTKTDVGYYNAAVRIKVSLVGVVTALGTVLLPRSSYYVESGQMDAFRAVTKKAVHFVWIFATPLMLFFMLFARPSILLLSGAAYEASIRPMQWIMPTLLLIGLTNILGIQVLVPTGREKMVLISVVAGAAVDLVLNALLIPRLASTGAAIGTLAAEVVVLIMQYFALGGEAREAFRGIDYGKLAIALAVAAGASFWVPMLGMGRFVTLLIGALLFFGVYLAALLVQRESMARELTGQVVRRLKREKKAT